MKLYRFSPITAQETLYEAANHVHIEANRLCHKSFGYFLPNAGNMGIFCHYDDEYDSLIQIRKELTEPSDNINQKYFRLHKPIVISAINEIPETTYTHLYVRRPDPYRHHVGDVDFYLEPEKYVSIKQGMLSGKVVHGARVFGRTDLDMIELYDPDVDVLAYVSTVKMSEGVRVKLADATIL